jgi:hypothetical protein
LVVLLAVGVAGFVAQRLDLFDSSSSSSSPALSSEDARAAQAELERATVPPSYRRATPCASATTICFNSSQPLAAGSTSGTLALIQSFGLPVTNIALFNCGGPPPNYRGRHLMGAIYGCGGIGSLGRFVSFFSVTSMDSDCRALRPHVGTHVEFGVSRVGKVDSSSVEQSSAVKQLQSLNASAAAIARDATAKNHLQGRTDWPARCRG